MIVTYIRRAFKKLFVYEQNAHRFAFACSLAIYIAFSPFVGFHTMMLIGAGWFFRLSVPLLLSVGYLINNPLTLAPILVSCYGVGYWVLHTVLQIKASEIDPAWMLTVNGYIGSYIGIEKVSFWAFMVGANLLGIVLALLSYPIMKELFSKWRVHRRARKGIV